ncbi:MAG: S1 RNA-binding domain-containing protein, partial [Flavobacterium sp.]
FEMGDAIQVFVYLDHEERPVATTLIPYITLHDFAFLRVNYTNEFGAFLDWGLEKDLFVPFREQANKMEQGKRYLVYMYADNQNGRLVASSKLNQFLNQTPPAFIEGQEVELIISHPSDLGMNVIINATHKGLVYTTDIFEEHLRPGDKSKGFIKTVRPDGKIDVSFRPQGLELITEDAQKIMNYLNKGNGILRLTDSSSPEDIKAVLQMSKKSFKKAIGTLYKERKIRLEDDGIYLL